MFPYSNFPFWLSKESICKNIKGKIKSHFSCNNFVQYVKIVQGMGNKFINIGFLSGAEKIRELRDWGVWNRQLPPLFLVREGSITKVLFIHVCGQYNFSPRFIPLTCCLLWKSYSFWSHIKWIYGFYLVRAEWELMICKFGHSPHI